MTDTGPLYPPLEPYRSRRLRVDTLHELCFAEFGDPQGLPALFLHGGPGSGCNPEQARLFDPARYRLIQLDQRGSGHSRPPGEVRDNHTGALVDDIEALREHLAIERWLAYGGSWGATLAVEYAKRHPARVSALVLRAPFLARREDLDWFSGPGGIARELPAAYSALLRNLDLSVGDDPIARLHGRLMADDLESAYQAALAWETWEAAVMGVSAPQAETDPDLRARRLARNRIHVHYCQAGFFLGPNGVLDGLQTLKRLPGILVQGQADRVCRHQAARILAAALPQIELRELRGVGHGLHEPALAAAVRQALDEMAGL